MTTRREVLAGGTALAAATAIGLGMIVKPEAATAASLGWLYSDPECVEAFRRSVKDVKPEAIVISIYAFKVIGDEIVWNDPADDWSSNRQFFPFDRSYTETVKPLSAECIENEDAFRIIRELHTYPHVGTFNELPVYLSGGAIYDVTFFKQGEYGRPVRHEYDLVEGNGIVGTSKTIFATTRSIWG